MVEEIHELPKKPSFISSVISGITGFAKGALSGGAMGAIAGAALAVAAVGVALLLPAAVGVGGIAGIAAWLSTEAAIVAPTVGAVLATVATSGAILGASAIGTVGAAAGTITGVVRSREAGQPSAEDVVNVAKISFEQGRAVQHNMEQTAHGHHAAKVTGDRAAAAIAGATAEAGSRTIN